MSKKPESDSDENNNCTVFRTTMFDYESKRASRTKRYRGNYRDSKIIYSEDFDPKDVDIVLVTTDILTEVPKHFTDEHVNVILVKGNL